MPFASTSLGAEQPLLNSELLGYGRDPLAPVKDAVTADGDVVVPIDAEAFGFWLKAAFGAPVTTGTAPGPFTHTFQSGSWTLPSMAIETAMPEVPRYAIYSGVVLDQLSWQMQRSGLLTATARLVAQGETVATTSGAGTPAELDLIRFGHFNGAIKRNGTALGNVISTEITYANNLDRIETIRADGMTCGADPSIAALTGRTEVRFADQTTPCELEFSYSLISGDSLTVTVHAVYLPRPRIEIGGPQGIQASFDRQASKPVPQGINRSGGAIEGGEGPEGSDATLGRMCTVTLVNPPGRNGSSLTLACVCRSCPSPPRSWSPPATIQPSRRWPRGPARRNRRWSWPRPSPAAWSPAGRASAMPRAIRSLSPRTASTPFWTSGRCSRPSRPAALRRI